MKLIGMLDSPFVRRVAITAQFLDLKLEYSLMSIFRNYDDIRAINPMVKVPSLICDDGTLLVDSTLIIAYLESITDSDTKLTPGDPDQRLASLSHTGTALVAMEKIAQLIYERSQRPEEKQHEPWKNRLEQQQLGALRLLEAAVDAIPNWIFGDKISHADISIAIAWRFAAMHSEDRIDLSKYPKLAAFSKRAEALPEFVACSF